ncbi:MAG: putative protein conserved in bacteria [Candidatus Midichloria mitochondrii]|nr:hypothetical protein [Candidatus Midichloria mitochondrii]
MKNQPDKPAADREASNLPPTDQPACTQIHDRLLANQQAAEQEISRYLQHIGSDKLTRKTQSFAICDKLEAVTDYISQGKYTEAIDKLEEIKDLAIGVTWTKNMHYDGSEHLIRDATHQETLESFNNLVEFVSTMQKSIAEIRVANELIKIHTKKDDRYISPELQKYHKVVKEELGNITKNIIGGRNPDKTSPFNYANFHRDIRAVLKDTKAVKSGKDDAIEKARSILQVMDKQYHVSTITREKDAKEQPIYVSRSQLLALGANDPQSWMYKAVAAAEGTKYKKSGGRGAEALKNRQSVESLNWYNSMVTPIRVLTSKVALEIAEGRKTIPYFSSCLPGLKVPSKVIESAYSIQPEYQSEKLASAEVFSTAGTAAQKVVTDEGNRIRRGNMVRRFFKERKHKQDTVYQTEANIAHLQAIVGEGKKLEIKTVGEDREEINKALKKAKDRSAKKDEDPLKNVRIANESDASALQQAIRNFTGDKDNFLNTTKNKLKLTKEYLKLGRAAEIFGRGGQAQYDRVNKELDDYLASNPESAKNIAEIKYLVSAKFRNRSRLFGKKPPETEQVVDTLVARFINKKDDDTVLVLNSSEASVLDLTKVDSKALQEARFVKEGITSEKTKEENRKTSIKAKAMEYLISILGAHGHKDVPETQKASDRKHNKLGKLNVLSRFLLKTVLGIGKLVIDIIMISINYLSDFIFPQPLDYGEGCYKELTSNRPEVSSKTAEMIFQRIASVIQPGSSVSNSISTLFSELAKKDPINLSAVKPQALNTNPQMTRTQSNPLHTKPKHVPTQKPSRDDYDERLNPFSEKPASNAYNEKLNPFNDSYTPDHSYNERLNPFSGEYTATATTQKPNLNQPKTSFTEKVDPKAHDSKNWTDKVESSDKFHTISQPEPEKKSLPQRAAPKLGYAAKVKTKEKTESGVMAK